MTCAHAASTASGSAGRPAVSARGLVALPAQVPLDRGERAAEPVGQGLQALVRVGVAQPDDLVVVDLAVPAVDPGQGVEVLGLRR